MNFEHINWSSVAQETGLTPTYIRFIFLGERKGTPVLDRIARALGVDVETLKRHLDNKRIGQLRRPKRRTRQANAPVAARNLQKPHAQSKANL